MAVLMAHIDVGTTNYLLMEGDPKSANCACWQGDERGHYADIPFADGPRPFAGRVVAEICVRAINEAIRQGQLPTEEEA